MPAAASRLCHEITLALPDLPAELQGVRIAHVTDLHITRVRRHHSRIADALAGAEADLVALTGDYIDKPGQEAAGHRQLRHIVEAAAPALGFFGVFGNHDTAAFRKRVADLPVRWLFDEGMHLDGLPMEVWGVDTHHHHSTHDALAVARRIAAHNGHPRPAPRADDHVHDDDAHEPRTLRLMLCHMPTFMITAADLDMDLMLAGHTHGGQCRLPGARALINSCDLPLHLTSGVLRHRHTLCAVSRGLGETMLPLRIWCGSQLPIYTLRRGPRLGKHTDHVDNVMPW